MKKIAIIGGGLSGLTAAYYLHQAGAEFALFEASHRLGGIVETYRDRDFIIECGPDSWVTDKPWARELAAELGLEDEIVPSNDHARRTHILVDGALVPMPDGLRMMVPQHEAAMQSLLASPLFSDTAKQAYLAEPARAEELKAHAAAHEGEDESVASFVRRHFGDEVASKLAAPLLSGVFGGSIEMLSVRAVMAPFVALERQYGSLIVGLRERNRTALPAAIFSSLKTGLQTLIDRMVAVLPVEQIRLNTRIESLEQLGAMWSLGVNDATESFNQVILATSPTITKNFLPSGLSTLLPQEASSAIIVALAFDQTFPLPEGFGFLVPQQPEQTSRLLATTFIDQKFTHRTLNGGRILRAFFADEGLMDLPDSVLVRLALNEIATVLGQPLPDPKISIVRRLPHSLPLYAVNHLERIRTFESQVAAFPGLRVIGNGQHGVGLPDLIRQAKEAAQWAAS